MRYVPNLIPQGSKILPHYFKGNIYVATKKNPIRNIVFWTIGIFFFIGSLAFIKHPIMFLFFGLIGFILIPLGHQLLERKLKFKLTRKIKAFVVSMLLGSSLPLAGHYNTVDQKIAYEQKLADEKEAKIKAITSHKEQQRKDSLLFYITEVQHQVKKNKLEKANELLQHAMAFANLPADKKQLEKERIGIATIKTLNLVKAGKYETALTEISHLLNSTPSNSELIYNRAICYSKTGKIREAVYDLKSLIQSGNSQAEKLHEKINPIRKRVAYYVTRCWDGSTSSATGRGACSRHGGVKNWNEPVYEEYRKYE
ncbi:MAG TPA: hypothetical protein VFQ56_02425 [Flavobacterium sp.]|nr:hypothetical protein [Flavobacterium sp.]